MKLGCRHNYHKGRAALSVKTLLGPIFTTTNRGLANPRIAVVSSSNHFPLVSSLPATPHRPPLPEQDATQEEKTKNIIFPSSDLRTGEAVSQTGW